MVILKRARHLENARFYDLVRVKVNTSVPCPSKAPVTKPDSNTSGGAGQLALFPTMQKHLSKPTDAMPSTANPLSADPAVQKRPAGMYPKKTGCLHPEISTCWRSR